MEECHICGRPAVGRGIVEGVAVWLCAKDMSFGKPVAEPQITQRAIPSKAAMPSYKPALTAPRPQPKPKEHSIADDFGNVIARAREKLGLTRKQLANQLFIMENVLERIEHGHLVPDIKVAQKLEKALGIKLVVEEEKGDAGEAKAFMGGRDDAGGSTLADVVDVKIG